MASMSTRSVIPFNLHANDIKQHILTIDSRFRDTTAGCSDHGASDFYFTLLSPVKNVLRIRITSFEFPNNYHIFSSYRKNVSFQILYQMPDPMTFTVVIPSGNYTAYEMANTLNALFKLPGALPGEPAMPTLSISFDAISGSFVFASTNNLNISIDTTYNTFDRPYEYGLGYYIGFTKGIHNSLADSSGNYSIRSNILANFAGDPYILLKINDFDCVRHTMGDSDITALAKIRLVESKNYMSFDDYSNKHIKEIVFPTPQNLSRLHVQILDPYGIPLDMSHCQVSFSIEVLEIKSLGLYTTIRDAFMSNL
jgi:hypothetical protein